MLIYSILIVYQCQASFYVFLFILRQCNYNLKNCSPKQYREEEKHQALAQEEELFAQKIEYFKDCPQINSTFGLEKKKNFLNLQKNAKVALAKLLPCISIISTTAVGGHYLPNTASRT
jgi:hypothetical protein